MNRLSAMMLAVLWAVSQGVLAVPAEAAESGKTGQVIVRNGEQASIKGADTIFKGLPRAGAGGCGAGADCYFRCWPDSGMGQGDAGNQGGGCSHMPCGSQALARRRTE